MSPPPPAPSEAWVLRSSPSEWDAHAREATAARVHGLCVLDVTHRNIFSYAQGSMDLIRCVLSHTGPPYDRVGDVNAVP